jgi:alcohol/geraniol dehydrogenase (NADP+)
MSDIRAWAARSAGAPLEPFSYDPGPLDPEDVEVAVEWCGVCHSDLSMLDNEWGISAYPFVPGHEAIGRVTALGEIAARKGLEVGQRVGVGWNARSCLHCEHCLRGDHHLCVRVQPTIVGHHGAFAERVRAHWLWTVPIPGGLDPSATGPLLCGGITVFAPLQHLEVKPTERVGVVGIGGLGHMSLMFLKAWGCDVTAFTSSPAKADEARAFGATRTMSSRDSAAMEEAAGQFDLILVTANAPLDWTAILGLLAPKGRLHFVGAVLEPVPVPVMALLMGQKRLSASPTGSRAAIDAMLRFAEHHAVTPKVEHFRMSRVNEAMDHLRAGKASYRIVLEADF